MIAKEINTETDKINETFAKQKAASIRKRTESADQRRTLLLQLRQWIHANRPRIHHAAFKDFRKPSAEVDAIEIFHVLNEIHVALANLRSWTNPLKVDAPWTMLGTRSRIVYEPKGVSLIISPWNYPFSLAIGPLVSALAAGNTAIIKPSEHTPHVARLINELVTELFPPDVVSVFEGDADVAKKLLALPFDHIFFTGSPSVGKIVMRAAAENLSSITLELGGKSPAIVSASANLDEAAERIAVSKFVNNGQTCVAPDYVLAEEKIYKPLIEKIIHKTRDLFADNNDFSSSHSYCRIVNQNHFDRLEMLVSDAVSDGATIEMGGNNDRDSRFFSPVVLSNVDHSSRIMKEEIFGPVLPVLPFQTENEVVEVINAHPKPLGLYVFSRKKSFTNLILTNTSSGGACINDCAIHFLNHNLPFGGVNNSGIGKSHGYAGFLAFSNEKPILKQKSGWAPIKLFYPPYSAGSKRILDWFLKFF